MSFLKLAKGLFILGLMVGNLTTFSYSANAGDILNIVDSTKSSHYIIRTRSRIYFIELFEEFCNYIIHELKISSSTLCDISIMDLRVYEAVSSIDDAEQLQEYIKSTIAPVVNSLNVIHTTQYKDLMTALENIE